MGIGGRIQKTDGSKRQSTDSTVTTATMSEDVFLPVDPKFTFDDMI